MLHNQRKSQGKETFNFKKNVPWDLEKVNALTTKSKYSVLGDQINCRVIAIKTFPCESATQVKMMTHHKQVSSKLISITNIALLHLSRRIQE
jgi:hypothetical protein